MAFWRRFAERVVVLTCVHCGKESSYRLTASIEPEPAE